MKFKAALCASALLLSGCQLLPTEGPLTDTLRAMKQRPEHVVLTDEQRKNFPYASQYFRMADGPQALIVLARFAGHRSVYASSEGRSLLIQQGRVMTTLGFPTNFHFIETPFPPQVALYSPNAEPVCWGALWRASGELIASNYRLTGCLKRVGIESVNMPEGKVDLMRVQETVSALQVGKHYENTFWLEPETGRVLASRQQGGPDLPQLHLMRVIPEPANEPAAAPAPLAPEPLPSDQRPAGSVEVQHQGLVQGYAYRAATSAALVEPLADRKDIDWQESALYRLDNTDSLKQTRDALVADLNDLAQHWQTQRQRALAVSAQALAKDLQAWRLAHRVVAELHPQVLFLQEAKSIQLKGQNYLLVLAAPRQDTPVWGVVFDHDLRWQGSTALSKLADSRYLRAGADHTQVWLSDALGKTQVLGLKTWNAKPTEWEAGSRLFVGFEASVLPSKWSTINARLRALAPHRLP